MPRHREQRGVQQRHVLARQQADAAEFVRQRDGDARALLAQDLRCFQLEVGIKRREHARHADGRHAGRGDRLRRPAHADAVEGYERAPVDLVATANHVHRPAHHLAQIVGPVDERRQRRRRGQTDAHGCHAADVAPLHHRIREVRGADHHGADLPDRHLGDTQ